MELLSAQLNRRNRSTFNLSPEHKSEHKTNVKQNLIDSLVYALSQPIESGAIYQSIDPKDERVAVYLKNITNNLGIFLISYFFDNEAQARKLSVIFAQEIVLKDKSLEFANTISDRMKNYGLLGTSNMQINGVFVNWLSVFKYYLQELNKDCDKVLDRYSFASDELVEAVHKIQSSAININGIMDITSQVDPTSYQGAGNFHEQHLEFIHHFFLEVVNSRNIASKYLKRMAGT